MLIVKVLVWLLGRRTQRATAETIARQLLDEGLEGEELFQAMWDWHDTTGIETRDMFAHYKTLQSTT